MPFDIGIPLSTVAVKSQLVTKKFPFGLTLNDRPDLSLANCETVVGLSIFSVHLNVMSGFGTELKLEKYRVSKF